MAEESIRIFKIDSGKNLLNLKNPKDVVTLNPKSLQPPYVPGLQRNPKTLGATATAFEGAAAKTEPGLIGVQSRLRVCGV